MKKKFGWIPVAFYVLAVIFGLYTIFALVSTTTYIGEYVSSGYVSVSESFSDILAYYVSSVGAYLFYAVACWFMGFVVKILLHMGKAMCPAQQETVEEQKECACASACVEESVPTPGPVYCTKCYKVFKGDAIPDICPECGNPMK